MKKNLTEIVFILDRSGSMSGLEADTIGGYNSLIEKQKKEEGEAYISTVLFDDVCEVLHDRVPMDKVPVMTDEEYAKIKENYKEIPATQYNLNDNNVINIVE